MGHLVRLFLVPLGLTIVFAGTCQFGDISVHTSQAKYLTPQVTSNGLLLNVYAECNGRTGQVECFQEPLEADAPGVPIACPHQQSRRRELGVYLPRLTQLWTHGVMCYQVNEASNFTETELSVLFKAMDQIEEKSNVRFISRRECLTNYQDHHGWMCGKNCSNYVHVRSANGTTCSATVGMAGRGEQYINLSPRCFWAGDGGSEEGTIIHELSHAMGLKHEHQHRDRQVVVLHDRMTVSPSNYIMLSDMNVSDYELGSIMHYGPRSLCVPLDPCEEAPEPPVQEPVIAPIDDPWGDDGWVDTIDDPGLTCLPPGLRFCDAVETPGEHNCTIATIDMCKVDVKFGQRKQLSPGDVHAYDTMYPEPPFRSMDYKLAQFESNRPQFVTLIGFANSTLTL